MMSAWNVNLCPSFFGFVMKWRSVWWHSMGAASMKRREGRWDSVAGFSQQLNNPLLWTSVFGTVTTHAPHAELVSKLSYKLGKRQQSTSNTLKFDILKVILIWKSYLNFLLDMKKKTNQWLLASFGLRICRAASHLQPWCPDIYQALVSVPFHSYHYLVLENV